MKQISLIFLLLMVLLGACTSAPVQTMVPSETSTPSATTTLTKTNTPEPTATPTPVAIPTMALPRITFTPIPIKDADYSSPSPNGQWTAYTFWEGVPQMTVQNKNKTIQWFITEGYFPEFPYTYVPIHWTKDSRYLFYNRYYEIDGFMAFYNGAGLYRLDIETGVSRELIPAAIDRWNKNFPIFSFAPDDTFLVYILPEEGTWYLTVYDIANETEEKYKLEEGGGSILWAKDQSYILFSSYTLNDWNDIPTTIKKFEFAAENLTTVMPAVTYIVDLDKWITSQKILWHFRGGDYYTLDLQSGETKLQPNYTPESK